MTKVVVSVGQFIHRKGFDVLLKAWAKCSPENVLYIIGAEPTEEYLALKNQLELTNVFFVGFKAKEELKQYYRAADLFVLPTREDIWGLVVNEAMANGLPVITTNRCVSGIELVKNGVNGYIVQVDDVEEMANRIRTVLEDNVLRHSMAENSLATIRDLTVERMAEEHCTLMQRFLMESE